MATEFPYNACSAEVCYDELGCFSDDWPFTSVRRPVPHLPWAPEEIGTQFWLYTKFNQIQFQPITYADEQTILDSHFSPLRTTKIIVHGFISGGDSGWVMDLKNAILSKESTNVIVVDWSNGANPNLVYGQAATNTRVVGAQIALLISKLKSATGALSKDIHIMGHSLGAHVAGYAGERLLNLGRITAMDAAEPYFQGTPFNVRLDPSDARYVDAIHTDGDPFRNMGWGMIDPVGHADFYPNGGHDQPGCPGNDVDDGEWWKVSCSHDRSHDLMIDSIVNAGNPMYGHVCDDYDTYLTGACDTCPYGGCPTLGYYFDEVATSDQVNVMYYLSTGSQSPYGSTDQ